MKQNRKNFIVYFSFYFCFNFCLLIILVLCARLPTFCQGELFAADLKICFVFVLLILDKNIKKLTLKIKNYIKRYNTMLQKNTKSTQYIIIVLSGFFIYLCFIWWDFWNSKMLIRVLTAIHTIFRKQKKYILYILNAMYNKKNKQCKNKYRLS